MGVRGRLRRLAAFEGGGLRAAGRVAGFVAPWGTCGYAAHAISPSASRRAVGGGDSRGGWRIAASGKRHGVEVAVLVYVGLAVRIVSLFTRRGGFWPWYAISSVLSALSLFLVTKDWLSRFAPFVWSCCGHAEQGGGFMHGISVRLAGRGSVCNSGEDMGEGAAERDGIGIGD